MWQRQIHVPRLLRHVLADRGRLRVVHDDHVPAAGDLGGVERVVALEDLPLLLAERVGVALQRVVEALGDVVELLAPEHDLPLGVDADVVHQRDQRVEDLRHAAAERGGGEVEHPQPSSGSASSRISWMSGLPARWV